MSVQEQDQNVEVKVEEVSVANTLETSETLENLDTLDNNKDVKKIILLVDNKISSDQKRHMLKHFSVLEFEEKWHAKKKITSIAGADIFVINIGRGFSDRTAGIKFYETNLKLFKKNEYTIIYFRTEEYVRKDNLDKLKYDYRIVELPSDTNTAEDYLFLIESDKMPQIRPWYSRLWQSIIKKN